MDLRRGRGRGGSVRMDLRMRRGVSSRGAGTRLAAALGGIVALLEGNVMVTGQKNVRRIERQGGGRSRSEGSEEGEGGEGEQLQKTGEGRHA
jgi:hypothetical protein